MLRNMDILLKLQRDIQGGTMSRSQPSRGLFPLLKSSHSVAPKLHLSHSRVKLSGDISTSGATQGILSTTTKKAITCDSVANSATQGNLPGTYHLSPASSRWFQGRSAWWREGRSSMGRLLWPAAGFWHRCFHEWYYFAPAKKQKKKV